MIITGLIVLVSILVYELIETRKIASKVIASTEFELWRYKNAYEYVNSERNELRRYTQTIVKTIREIDSYGR